MFKKLIEKLPIKSEFFKNTFKLAIGTSIAQFFPIFFYPILGRIYSPADFGLLATITSITAILAVLTTGRYEDSILIAKTKKDTINIISLILLISLTLLIILSFFLLFFSAQLGILFNESDLTKWLFISPISAFAIIIFNIYNEWCVRNKDFIRLSWNKIYNSSAVTFFKLFFGIVKVLSGGLVIGDLLGRIINSSSCVYRILKKEKNTISEISFKHMKKMAIRYSEFPRYNLPGQLSNTIGKQFPILIIGAYFNSIEVGYYSMTMSILSIPISVISSAISNVFRQKANREFNEKGNFKNIYLKILKTLTLVSILGLFSVIFFLPKIFALVLGDQWQIAGEYSQILLPMIAISFINMSMRGVFIITQKLRALMFWQFYYVGISIVSLLVGIFIFKNIKMTLVCYAIGRTSAYLINMVLSYKYSQGSST